MKLCRQITLDTLCAAVVTVSVIYAKRLILTTTSKEGWTFGCDTEVCLTTEVDLCSFVTLMGGCHTRPYIGRPQNRVMFVAFAGAIYGDARPVHEEWTGISTSLFHHCAVDLQRPSRST